MAFCRGYDWLRTLPAACFSRIWRDPSAYLWGRVAYELVAASRGLLAPSELLSGYCASLGTDVHGALAAHLHRFKHFMLAAAYAAQADIRFDEPLTLTLPATVPGCPLTLIGAEPLPVEALHDGGLVIPGHGVLALRAGASLGPWRVQGDPVVRAGACEVRLQPALFHIPGLVETRGLLTLEPDYQTRYATLVEGALDCVRRYHPETFADMERELQVVALKPRNVGGYGNVSHSDLPGACVVSVLDEPHEMADALIHEFHHHRLFVLEEGGRFFDESRQNPHTDCRYYSPWREGPRPLHGLLHAVYVFLPVRAYWQAVESDSTLDAALRTYARSQWVMLDGQLRAACTGLQAHGLWTECGANLLAALVARLGTEAADTTAVPALYCSPEGRFQPFTDPDTGQPLTVHAQLERHARQFTAHPAPVAG